MSTSNQSSKMEQQKQHQHQQQNQNKRKFPSDASASDDSMATPAEMKQLMLDSVQSNVSFRDIKMKRRKLPAAMYTSDGESVCSSSEGSFAGSSASSSSDSPSALLPTSRSGTTDSRGSMAEGSVSSCSPGVQNSSEDDGSPKGSNEGDCGGGGGSGYEGRSENDEQGDMESRVDSSQERMLNSIDHRRSEEQQNLNYQRPLKVCTSEYGESWDYVTNRDSAANRAREMMTHAQYSPRQHPYLLYSSYQHSPLIPNHTQSAYNMVYNERQPSYSIPSNTYNITTTSTEVYNNYRYAQTSDSEQCAGLDYSAKTLTAQANLQKISPYSLSHSYPSPTTVGYNRSSQFQPYWPPGYQPDYSPRSNGVNKALRSPRSETSGSDKCNSDTSYSNCTKESYSYPETGRSIEQGLTPTSIKVNTSNNDSLLMYSNKNHQEHYNAVVTRKDSNFITALRPQSPCRTNSRVVGDSGHVTNDNYSTDKHEHTTTQRPQSVDSSSAQQSRMSAPLSTVVTTTKAQMTSTAAANTATPSNDDNNSDMVTSAVTAPSSCGGNEQTGPSKQGLKLAYVQITPSVLAPVWLPEEAKTMGSPTMSQMPALGTQLVPMVGKVKTEGGREKVITFPTLGAPPSSSGSPIQISTDEVLPTPTNKHHHQKNCGISPGSKPGGDSADLTYPVVHLHERVPPPWMPELWEQRKIKKEEGNGDSAVSAPPGHTINWQQLVQLKDCQKALIQQWAEQEKKVKDLGESGDSEPGLSCEICQDRASGLHYGIITCEGCKGFFKRTVQNRRTYTCVGTGTCEVTKAQRNRCQYCRFRKCLDKGMILAAVREDRSPGGRSSGAVYNMYKGKYRRRLAGSSRASSAGSDTASVADSEDSNTSSNNNMMAPVVMPPPPAVQQAPNHPIFSRQFSLPTPQNNPLGQQQQQQKQQQQQQQSQLGAILTSQPVEVKIKQEVSWQSPPSLLLSSPNERINGMMRMTALGTMQGCGNVGSDSGASFQVPKNVMPSSSSSCTYRAPEGMSVAASSQVSPRDSGDVDSRLHELNTQRNSNQQSQGSGGTSIDKHNHQDSENLQYRNDSSSSQSQVRQQQQQQQAQHNLSTSQPSRQQQQPDQEPHRTQASFAFSSSNQSSGGQNCHLVSSDNKPTAESGKILAKYSKEPLPGASLSVVSELLTTDSIIKSLTSVQRSMTLLSNLSDLTYTMCALSDDIVAHLAAWMKALPFYSDIPLAASSDVLSNSWCSMLLLVTCLAKAQSHMATDSRSKCVLLDTPVSSPGPAVPGDVEDPAADVCLDTVDIKEMEQDSPPSNRGEFYELLRLNMKFLHEHMMGVMQRTLQFGELYDAMGMMTERVTHIVHKMITLGITPSEAACLKVILLLHQDSSKKHNEVSQIQRYYIWVLKAHLQDSESHPSQTPPPQTPTPAGSEENKTTTASSGFKMPQDNRTPSPGMASPLTQAAQSKLQRARQHQRHRIVELIKLLRFTKVVAEVLVKNKLLYLPILLNATGSVDAGGSVVGKKEPS